MLYTIYIINDLCWINVLHWNININVLHALDRDITRMPAIMPVLPLADAGWALGSSVNTLVDTIATYRNTSTPGAVPVSVQISAIAITVPVDWRPHTGEFPMGVGHRVENGWCLTKVAVV